MVVVLLASFVFREPWGIPAAGLLAAMGAVLGERSPLGRWWIRLADRRGSPPALEPVQVQLRQSALLTAGLVIATLLVLLDATILAASIAAVVAAVAALGAVGLWNAAAEIERRVHRR